MTIKQQILTVVAFTKLGTRRFFRDRLALFFGILFPLVFLVVFGSISNSGSGNISFKVAVVNQSKSSFASTYAEQLTASKTFKVNDQIKTLTDARDKLGKGQVDGIIVLPSTFGVVKDGQNNPSGEAQVLFTQSATGTGQTLTTVLKATFDGYNKQYSGTNQQSFSVSGKALNEKRLSSFDYTFAGLLGFSIIGIGIFGPVNIFPELKKQGILRRLHTTPLKVWQYFMATMFSQAITGVVSIAIQFAVAISVFHLRVDGNYLNILVFTVLSIFMILGIGLAIGGWARNERQAAPLSNIVVFPMLFLSGTFFPRFQMPQLLQNITTYLPLTPVIDGLRLLTTEGKSLLDLGPQLAVMAVWMIIIYAVAFRVFKWE